MNVEREMRNEIGALAMEREEVVMCEIVASTKS